MAFLLIRSVIFLRGLLGAENIVKFVFDMFKASLEIASGNIPVVKDKFISLHSGKVRYGADIFSRLIGILEGPEDLESSKDCIIFNISSSDVKATTKSNAIFKII